MFTVFQHAPDRPLWNGDFDIIHLMDVGADSTACGIEFVTPDSPIANFQKGTHSVECSACVRERDRRSLYCRHGVYVGGCGIDYMCHWCESGEEPPSDLERAMARIARSADKYDEYLGRWLDVCEQITSRGQTIAWFVPMFMELCEHQGTFDDWSFVMDADKVGELDMTSDEFWQAIGV